MASTSSPAAHSCGGSSAVGVSKDDESHTRLIAYEYLEPRTLAWRWRLATLLPSLPSASSTTHALDAAAAAAAEATLSVEAGDGDVSVRSPRERSSLAASMPGTAAGLERVLCVQPWRTMADALAVADTGASKNADSAVVRGGKGHAERLSALADADLLLGRRRVRYSTLTGDGAAGSLRGDAEAEPRTEVGKKLAKEMTEKQSAVEQRIAAMKAHMAVLREEEQTAREQQAAMESAYAGATRELAAARELVKNIDPRHLKEIQSYRTPPAVVQYTMTAVLAVLASEAVGAAPTHTTSSGGGGSGTAAAAAVTSAAAAAVAAAGGGASSSSSPALVAWADIVSVMRQPAFQSSVAAFDPSALTSERRQKLFARYVQKPKFTYADAMKGSQAMGQLYNWVVRQLEASTAGTQLADFEASMAEYSVKAAEKHNALATAADELEEMEDELDALEAQYAQAEGTEETSRLSSRPDGSTSVPALAAPLPPDAVGSPLDRTITSELGRSITSSLALSTSDSCSGAHSMSAAEWKVSVRSARRPWLRPATVTPQNTTRILKTAVLCDELMQPSPSPGATLSLTPAQQQRIIDAIRARLQATAPEDSSGGDGSRTRATVLLGPAVSGTTASPAPRDVEPQPLPPSSSAVQKTLEQVQARLDALLAVDGSRSSTYQPTSDGEAASPQSVMVAVAQVEQQVHDLRAAALALHGEAAEPASSCRQRSVSSIRPAPEELLTATYSHTFVEQDWEMVVEDSYEELQRAITNDVSALCHVPGRALSSVAMMMSGSRRVEFDITHHVALSPAEVQAVLDAGPFPETSALYDSRHTRHAAREDARQQAARDAAHLTALESSLDAVSSEKAVLARTLAAQSQQLARREKDLQLAQEALIARQNDMTRLVTRTSTQAEELEELREQLAVHDAVNRAEQLRQLLQDKDELLAAAEMQLHSSESRWLAREQHTARRHAEELSAVTASHTARHASLQLLLDAAEANAREALAKHQAADAGATAERDALLGRLHTVEDALRESERLAEQRQQELQQQQQQQQQEEEAATTTTTTHTHTFSGEEWAMVLDDSAESLHRALVHDVADLLGLPSKAVVHVACALGSLTATVAIQHTAALTEAAINDALREGPYPTVDALYACRHARRQPPTPPPVEPASSPVAAPTGPSTQQQHQQQQQQEEKEEEKIAKDEAHRAERSAADDALVAALEEDTQSTALAVARCQEDAAAAENQRCALVARAEAVQRLRSATAELTCAPADAAAEESALIAALAAIMQEAEAADATAQRDATRVESALQQRQHEAKRARRCVRQAEARRRTAKAAAVGGLTRSTSHTNSRKTVKDSQQQRRQRATDDGDEEPTVLAEEDQQEDPGPEEREPSSEENDNEDDDDDDAENEAHEQESIAVDSSQQQQQQQQQEQPRRRNAATTEEAAVSKEARRRDRRARRALKERLHSLRETAQSQHDALDAEAAKLRAALQQNTTIARALVRELLEEPLVGLQTASETAADATSSLLVERRWARVLERARVKCRASADALWMNLCFGGVMMMAWATLRYKRFSI